MPHPGPSNRLNRRPSVDWPSWRYGPNGEAAIFKKEADVPYGWTKKPGTKFEQTSLAISLDRPTLVALLADKGIIAHPTWSARYMKELVEK